MNIDDEQWIWIFAEPVKQYRGLMGGLKISPEPASQTCTGNLKGWEQCLQKLKIYLFLPPLISSRLVL